ncbi:7-deoxyloganetin glucosyltransferase-like [Syzygium oleosum]|uniref:7-deoxyloganetin glucosyltransferase-like n=1 Tax=Syzygium oleosum TaxID=219896 RepID=UPI0011D25B73|nr:7-deoxyloganetin glucosyltransferase-like [Syzygium oleosum]
MSSEARDKPHAVVIPYPAQGHINPILKLAKILHHRGFHITFVHTEYNHKRLLKSRGPSSLEGLPRFRFETIPDGLPTSESDEDVTQHIPSLCDSTSKNCLAPFMNLLGRLNEGSVDDTEVPKVSCVIADGAMSFALDAAEKLGVPGVLFWTPSACGALVYTQYHMLREKGLFPLKDASYLTNGFLDTTIDWIPGMKNIRLRDLPSFIRTTDANDIMVNYIIREMERTHKASAVILNTFHCLEKDVLMAFSSIFPNLYTIGPIHLLLNKIEDDNSCCIGSNLWKEDPACLGWLDSKEPNSVLYINFGSIAVITGEQLIEFAWGLANSQKPFLWIMRSDLVAGDMAVLPSKFLAETKERGMLAGWCPQERVLRHPSVGGFLTHCGWNSMLESICSGVPVLCWPFFAEQQTNCFYSKNEWGIGMEIDNDVKRDEVEKLVRELMDGEKGRVMKKKAMDWKRKAEEATEPGGSSYENLETLMSRVLLKKLNG